MTTMRTGQGRYLIIGLWLAAAIGGWQCRDGGEALRREPPRPEPDRDVAEMQPDALSVRTVTATDSIVEKRRHRWRRNPFQPVDRRRPSTAPAPRQEKSAPPPPRYRLQGVFWDGRQTIAIINNQMVLSGKRYDGFEVLEITPRFVRIRTFPENQVLTLQWSG